jgi:hypothetical protein
MNDMYNADIKRCLKNSLAKQNFFEFCLTSNPGILEYRDLAFCLRIPTLDTAKQGFALSKSTTLIRVAFDSGAIG